MEKYTSQQPQSFWSKLENFWFYHKWHLLSVLLIICIFVVAIGSCMKKESIDMYVLYMVNGAYSTKANEELALKLEQYVDDIDGDGQKRVQIIAISFSDTLDRTDHTQEAALTRLVGQISSGPALFYIFDEENYAALKEAQVPIFAEIKGIDLSSSYINADRYNATEAGFFKDLKGWPQDYKTLYFGMRVADGINENDNRYAQIQQSRQTLSKIVRDHI